MQSDLDANGQMYQRVLAALSSSGMPFLIGGAYALRLHTGIHRETKDLDLFVLPDHVREVLSLLDTLGCPSQLVARHWLGKIANGNAIIDVIFGFRNGVGKVEKRWFHHAGEDSLFGIPVKILAVEEMIWSKAFVMERDRYDGADIAHLIRARASTLDWHRLLEQFGPYWLVLLSHLVMFTFIYPSDRDRIPEWLIQELTQRWRSSTSASGIPMCRGTLLSYTQYAFDLEHLGLLDARLQPIGGLLPENILE